MRTVLFVSAAVMTALAIPASAQSQCEAVEQLNEGETLAGLAERCDVTIEALLQANNADSAEELRARDDIAIPSDTVDWLDRARDSLTSTVETFEEAAGAAGRSVSEYISGEKDLERDVRDFASRLGLGSEGQGPRFDAEWTGQDEVRLSASGLPANTEMQVGREVEGEFRLIATVTTDAGGQVDETLRLDEPVPDQTVLHLQTADQRVRLASEAIVR